MCYMDLPFRIVVQDGNKWTIEKCSDRLQALAKIKLYEKLGIKAKFYYRQPKKPTKYAHSRSSGFKMQGLQGE